MINKLLIASILSFAIAISFFMYGIVNGAGCSYQLTNMKSDNNRETFLSCYRGKVVALHYHREADNKPLSTWKVEGRQLVYGEQVIYLVYNRERVHGGIDENTTDRYNRISAGYNMLFYKFKVVGDKVYIFKKFPNKKVLTSDFKGRISLSN
ncbi:hypothetical protein [Vibrio crassostreae]|uniref:hypothetical protein n=1 Tax=Vibrio crassostreae TaxID=246167 RepID=UPI000F46CBE8|nr:hypothetical protein [Vibrio crassostreae]ROO77090.1 hypothetical protein EDB53_0924 [Vibrio crassostreae]ROR75339.1 hypothetical protein EDB54_0846 [Vibrio crassostreae]TCV32788.1 hypothetical protein EDB70_101772 [Vibrio crassostreae]